MHTSEQTKKQVDQISNCRRRRLICVNLTAMPSDSALGSVFPLQYPAGQHKVHSLQEGHKIIQSGQRHGPGDFPDELYGLTQAEQMCIALANPIMRVLRLHGGHLGYRGHVVNVAQDVAAFAASLPRLGADIPSCSCAGRELRKAPRPEQLSRAVVTRALHWLKQHNPHYRGVGIAKGALSQLPENGPLPGIYNRRFHELGYRERHRARAGRG